LKNNIKSYLNKSGKKPASIIKDANVSRSTFYAVLKGDQIPKVDTAFKIARALEVEITELFPQLKEINLW